MNNCLNGSERRYQLQAQQIKHYFVHRCTVVFSIPSPPGDCERVIPRDAYLNCFGPLGQYILVHASRSHPPQPPPTTEHKLVVARSPSPYVTTQWLTHPCAPSLVLVGYLVAASTAKHGTCLGTRRTNAGWAKLSLPVHPIATTGQILAFHPTPGHKFPHPLRPLSISDILLLQSHVQLGLLCA